MTALTAMSMMMQETMSEIIGVLAPQMAAIMDSAAKNVAQQIEVASQGASASIAK